MEAIKSKICRVNWQAGDPERAHLEVQVQRSPVAEFPLAQGKSILCLLSPSADWTRPTHIMKSNLLYSKATDLNANLIQKRPHRNIQNNI